MPRSRPNRRDYVTVQLQRMMGKKSKQVALVADDPIANEQNVPDEPQTSQPSSDAKPFRTPSIPSASVAEQPEKWRRHDHNPGFIAENEFASAAHAKSPVQLDMAHVHNRQEIDLPSIQVEIPEDNNHYPPVERVQHNPSRQVSHIKN